MKTLLVPPGVADILPYVPGSAATAGDVVAIGNGIGIVTQDTAASARGTLAVKGRFTVNKVSAQAWTALDAIYWDSGSSVFTTVATGNRFAGFAVEAAANPSSTGELWLPGPTAPVAATIAALVNTWTANEPTAGSAQTIADGDAVGDNNDGGQAIANLTAKLNAVIVALKNLGVVADA